MIVAEKVAKAAITAGGIGTILAVSLIFVFLAWVVFPLFQSPRVLGEEAFQARESSASPFGIGVDEERLLSWTLHRTGELEIHDLRTGRRVDLQRPFEGETLTATSLSVHGDDAAFGFASGKVRLGRLGFATDFLEEDQVSEEVRGLKSGASTVFERGVVERTAMGQLRRTVFRVEAGDELDTQSTSPIRLLDHSMTPAGLSLAMLQEDGRLRVSRVREKPDMMTGGVRKTLSHAELVADENERGAPAFLRLSGIGQHVYVAWADGLLTHWDLRQFKTPVVYEELDLVEDPAAELTSLEFVAGKQTLVAGDSTGLLTTWFPARHEGEDGPPLLARSGELGRGDGAVLDIAASPRSRLLAASFASGEVRLFQASLGHELVVLQGAEPAFSIVVPPKEDAILGRGATRIATWTIDLEYPEANLTSMFLPVWYEGYAGPEHVWQSSSASDDFEPKLGLMPLVFGTIKATIYSMLFGAPLAILAAIYTSEFLAARLRSSIKSTVELMASLPSVVLGFLAALVIAPFVQVVLPGVMVALLTVPVAILAGAYVWQLLPGHLAIRWSGWQRFLAIGCTFPIGIGAAWLFSGPLESVLFAGDLEAWLDGRVGGAFGGWCFLLLPVGGLVAALANGAVVGPRIRARSAEWSRSRIACVDALRFVLTVIAAFAIAALLAGLFHGIGVDPRGGMVDTYVQRNALIVGFAMGFAIVPIIYTLAEDALSEVPSQLREASLGAGATHWQTAIRIVLPFAMSGIFSALMIGLGRAVGETMIVLMAAGNTPIMEWNVFNGFRTLSANIAVELPEAVVGSAHYRTLFLAALVLFAMTFALNTVAELVRRHFRKRTHAL